MQNVALVAVLKLVISLILLCLDAARSLQADAAEVESEMIVISIIVNPLESAADYRCCCV